MNHRARSRLPAISALLLVATGLLTAAPVAQPAARADEEVPSYVFASAPDLLNDDVADLRVSPYWRDGMPNGTNRSYESSLDVFLSDIRERGARDVLVAGDLVRGHWGIENRLHWMLDVCFSEHRCRTRKGNGADNMAPLRKMALQVLNQQADKESTKSRRKMAGWNDDYLLTMIQNIKI